MRLIDADALIEELYKNTKIGHYGEFTDGSEVAYTYNEISKAIEEQPTAFDTEKVVEEVKKLDLDGVSMVEDGKYTLVRRNEVISLIQTNGVCNGRQKSCKYCYKKDCPLSTEKTLSDKWSDIVKKGGAE